MSEERDPVEKRVPCQPGEVVDAGEDSYGPDRQRPIGIIHIMMWTACSALILATHQLHRGGEGLSSTYQIYLQVMHVLHSILYGAALPSLILFAYRRWKGGPPFPSQPGHWLLLIMGFQCVALFGVWALFEAIWSWQSAHSGGGTRVGLYLVAIAVPPAILYGVTGWYFRGKLRWRLYFWMHCVIFMLMTFGNLALLISSGAYAAFSVTRGLSSCMAVVWTVWLAIAILVDFANRLHRDWLHWTGVAVALAYQVLLVVHHVWDWFVSAYRR